MGWDSQDGTCGSEAAGCRGQEEQGAAIAGHSRPARSWGARTGSVPSVLNCPPW